MSREVRRGYRSVDKAYQDPPSVVLRNVVISSSRRFWRYGLRGWRIRTRDGGWMKELESSKEGLNTSNALIAEEPRDFVHRADLWDGLCMYTVPSVEGQMYKLSWTAWY